MVEKKKGLIDGIVDAILDFLKILEEMEKKGITEKTKEGEVVLPFWSKARYKYKVRIGKGFRSGKLRVQRGPPVFSPQKVKREVVNVFEGTDSISVVAELPQIKEENISLKIIGGVLKIFVNTPAGKINKDISIPKSKAKLEKASFKNGILEIKLSKQKSSRKKILEKLKLRGR